MRGGVAPARRVPARRRGRDLLTNVRGAADVHPLRSTRLGGAFELLSALDKAHHEMHEPHYYLDASSAPTRCTNGRARARPPCNRCSSAATPKACTAYLETQKEMNLAYYAAHAFELISKLEVRGVPPVWTMSPSRADSRAA